MSTKTEHKTIDIRFCDECGERYPRRLVNVCYGCEKNICSDCGSLLYTHPFDGTDNGDHCLLICGDCNQSLDNPAALAESIRTEANDRVWEIEKAWKKQRKTEKSQS